jgi:hypothetical protein
MSFADFAIHEWDNSRRFCATQSGIYLKVSMKRFRRCGKEMPKRGSTRERQSPDWRRTKRQSGNWRSQASIRARNTAWMLLPRIFNCFAFLPPCLMSRFGYTAVSNLGFLLGAGDNDWRASCRTRTGGGFTFALNVRPEICKRRASRARALLEDPRSVKRGARRNQGPGSTWSPPEYGRLPKFACN